MHVYPQRRPPNTHTHIHILIVIMIIIIIIIVQFTQYGILYFLITCFNLDFQKNRMKRYSYFGFELDSIYTCYLYYC